MGVRWQPGRLMARTLSGLELVLAEPGIAWGSPSEEHPNAIVYSDLYPGLDLEAEVRRGSLHLTTTFREWRFDLAPEQVDFFFVEAELVAAAALLEAVHDRAAAGEPFEQIPLYFGRADDEWAIVLHGHPGVSEIELAEHARALYRDEEGRSEPAPEAWRSSLWDLLQRGVVYHYFRYPLPVYALGERVSTTSAALTATFRFTATSYVRDRLYFPAPSPSLVGQGITGFDTDVCEKKGTGYVCKLLNNSLEAAKGDGELRRGLLTFFDGLKALKKRTDAGDRIAAVRLGTEVSHYRPKGAVAIDSDGPVAYSASRYIAVNSAAKTWRVEEPPNWPDTTLDPLNEATRPVSGGSIKVGGWSLYANPPMLVRTVGGKSFMLSELAGTRAGASTPLAVEDLRSSLSKRAPFIVILANPYDIASCSLCTANHSDPAVQALNGDYRVGTGFFDVRLEVELQPAPSHQANVLATSVGGHNDQLYPGETLAWDLELAAYSGNPDTLRLAEPRWDRTWFAYWHTDPATGATVYPADLKNVGDKVRVHLQWKRADPQLYGKTRDFENAGSFVNAAKYGGSVDIPVTFKPPEGQPSFSPIYTVFDDNIAAPMGLASITLPAQGLRGAGYARGELRWISGPTRQLVAGQHWDVWSWASPGNDGEVVIYPAELKPGTYAVELTPCLLPDGFTARFHCLPGSAQQLSFQVRAAAPTPVAPSIDFVAPWSLDSPGGGPVVLSIFGQDLGGGLSGTSVTIPQVVTGATPQSTSTATRLDLSIHLTASNVCGPRKLQVTTAGGADASFFNVVKPFQNAPHHFAIEAEAGVRNGLRLLPFPNASAGNVVGSGAAGTSGELTLRFRVPATSSDYQLYALYGTSGNQVSRADLSVSAGGSPVRSHRIALSPVAAGQFRLAALGDSAQPGTPAKLALKAGVTYELKIASVPNVGQPFPLLDLLVLSDGALPPTLAELCR
jgi:hypothetical protein